MYRENSNTWNINNECPTTTINRACMMTIYKACFEITALLSFNVANCFWSESNTSITKGYCSFTHLCMRLLTLTLHELTLTFYLITACQVARNARGSIFVVQHEFLPFVTKYSARAHPSLFGIRAIYFFFIFLVFHLPLFYAPLLSSCARMRMRKLRHVRKLWTALLEGMGRVTGSSQCWHPHHACVESGIVTSLCLLLHAVSFKN